MIQSCITWKKNVQDNRINILVSENICITYCMRTCQNKCPKCFLTACVPSLCVISFLTLCPWPPARSGFWFTMNMSEAEVRRRAQWLTQNLVQTTKNWNVDLEIQPCYSAGSYSGHYGYLCSYCFWPLTSRSSNPHGSWSFSLCEFRFCL